MSPAGTPWRLTLADHFLAEAGADGQALELTFCSQSSSGSPKFDGSPVSLGVNSIADKKRRPSAPAARAARVGRLLRLPARSPG
jgi:hypothetical protein